mmetsp:Transcript_30808/g.41833  ORF Transcript_30808/g.41833 Transcript_30808/m.41833 type:complete len:86 (+) Transcript_30808:2-259(+)
MLGQGAGTREQEKLKRAGTRSEGFPSVVEGASTKVVDTCSKWGLPCGGTKDVVTAAKEKSGSPDSVSKSHRRKSGRRPSKHASNT